MKLITTAFATAALMSGLASNAAADPISCTSYNNYPTAFHCATTHIVQSGTTTFNAQAYYTDLNLVPQGMDGVMTVTSLPFIGLSSTVLNTTKFNRVAVWVNNTPYTKKYEIRVRATPPSYSVGAWLGGTIRH
jgi:hypothetical protein